MRDTVTQWVNFWTNLCRPEQVIWNRPDSVGGSVIGERPRPPRELGEGIVPTPGTIADLSITDQTFSLGDISHQVADMVGVLQGRTLYVVAWRTREEPFRVGVVVTDSPGIVAAYGRQLDTCDSAWNALSVTEDLTLQLHLVFPARRLGCSLPKEPKRACGRVRPPFALAVTGQDKSGETSETPRISAPPCTRCKRPCANKLQTFNTILP